MILYKEVVIVIVFNARENVRTAARPTFTDMTKCVLNAIIKSNVNNGNVTVYTGHTTCSVIIQETSDGQNFYGTELIHQDLIDVLQKIIPTCTSEGQYNHPCRRHVELAAELRNEEACWSLNTDAHIRSVIMGRSVTIPIIDGQTQLGEFGHIWFADFDQIRTRERTVIIQVMGI